VTNVPSSLIIVALVVAWLVVLVPMIARKRQEVAKTSDTVMDARVLHGDSGDVEEELDMHVDESETAITDDDYRDYDEDERRPYRPGRGGYDPEAAAASARAKYAFRQRAVLALLVLAVISALFAGLVMPIVWWGHGGVDLLLVGYLGYLRRQVRIEAEVRERRQARIRGRVDDEAEFVETEYDDDGYERADYDEPATAEAQPVEAQHAEPEPVQPELSEYEDAPRSTPARDPYRPRPALNGTTVVDIDDEDPAFEELGRPLRRGYHRAAG
jgi:hypothetical protein